MQIKRFTLASICSLVMAAPAAWAFSTDTLPAQPNKPPLKATYLALNRLVPIKKGRALLWTDIVKSPSGSFVHAKLKNKAQLPQLDETSNKLVCWDAYSVAKAIQNQLDLKTKVVGEPACLVEFNRFISFNNISKSLFRYLKRNQLLPLAFNSIQVSADSGIGGTGYLTTKPGKKFVPIDGRATGKELQEFIGRDGLLLPSDANRLRWSSGKAARGLNTVYLEIIDEKQNVLGRLRLNANIQTNKIPPNSILQKSTNPKFDGRVLVTRGQRVAIQYKLRSLKIDLYGKALNQGKFGDDIVIEPDIKNGRGAPHRLKARIIGAGRVLVRP